MKKLSYIKYQYFCKNSMLHFYIFHIHQEYFHFQLYLSPIIKISLPFSASLGVTYLWSFPSHFTANLTPGVKVKSSHILF